MANCEDDLTSLDLDLLPPSTISSTLTGSTISLFPFILFSQSYGLNLLNPDTLNRVLRSIDQKDVVRDNEEVEAMMESSESEMISGGCLDTLEGDDELIIHVSGISSYRRELLNSCYGSSIVLLCW